MKVFLEAIKPFVTNIYFWIFVLFIVRLYGITAPPLEVLHNWRQTTVTMAARNFLEIDNNILYPRIDFAGNKTGITGMEFPLLNYLIYIVSTVFGYEHWYGRLINLIVSSVGLVYFYQLIKSFFCKSTAFNSTIVLAVSVWFMFSRKIMPDTFSVSIILAGIYYGTNYLKLPHKKLFSPSLFIYGTLILLGSLAKLPAAFLLILFAGLIFDSKIPIQKKASFIVVSGIFLVPTIWWYFSWVPYLVEEFGFAHFFMGKSIAKGAKELVEHFPLTIERFYFTALNFIGFGTFLIGIILGIKNKSKLLIYVLLAGILGFIPIMVKAGFTFSHHNYYIIPFVPIMALVAGYGLSQIRYRIIAIFLLLGICAEGILNQEYDFRIKKEYIALETLESQLNKFSSPEDLILINSAPYPTPMYFAHRKGWITSNARLTKKGYLDQLKREGLKYVVVLKKVFGTELQLDKEVVLNNDDFIIYKI